MQQDGCEVVAGSAVILWEAGNNDTPFYSADLHIVVADPDRAEHARLYYPGETNIRMADIVIINKVDTAAPQNVELVKKIVEELNPKAKIITAASPVTVEDPKAIKGKTVLVIEDGPTVTHGEMKFGAGFIAAKKSGAKKIIDPRPFAVDSIKQTFEKYKHLENVLPAMGYGNHQVKDLEETINAAKCDVVVARTGGALGIEMPHENGACAPERCVHFAGHAHGTPPGLDRWCRNRARCNGAEAPPVPAGAVYAFRRGTDGQLTYQSTITSADANSAGDEFGAPIATRGPVVLIGATGRSNRTGIVHEFAFDNNVWTSQRTFAPIGASTNVAFGSRIAMTTDQAVVSAPGESGGYGAAYVYRRVEEELRRDALVTDWGAFVNFLRLAARESGQMVNFAAISREVGLSQPTVKSYYQLQEDMFIGFQVPAYSKSPRKNLLSTPRFFFFDLGIRHAASGITPALNLVQADPGKYFEQGRFTATVPPDDAEKLTLLNFKADIV